MHAHNSTPLSPDGRIEQPRTIQPVRMAFLHTCRRPASYWASARRRGSTSAPPRPCTPGAARAASVRASVLSACRLNAGCCGAADGVTSFVRGTGQPLVRPRPTGKIKGRLSSRLRPAAENIVCTTTGARSRARAPRLWFVTSTLRMTQKWMHATYKIHAPGTEVWAVWQALERAGAAHAVSLVDEKQHQSRRRRRR